jgi:hypothetical protein
LFAIATRAGKKAAVDASSPLGDAGILKQVLKFAGTGAFIFYAPISKLWLECYQAVAAHTIKAKCTVMRELDLEVPYQRTLRRAVYASAARVRLAHELGLQYGSESAKLQFYIGAVACGAALAEAHRLGMPVSTRMMNGAASVGELSIVKKLHTQHNCAFDSETSACSAEGGHIELLQWLKQQGVVFTAYTMYRAAQSGQGSVCIYLHTEGCKWDERVMFTAAYHGHWGAVRKLCEHNCPCSTENICHIAAQQGDIEHMTYMLQQQEAVSAGLLSRMLNSAGVKGHLTTAQWLRQRGADWPTDLRYWSDDTREWARAEGCNSPLI